MDKIKAKIGEKEKHHPKSPVNLYIFAIYHDSVNQCSNQNPYLFRVALLQSIREGLHKGCGVLFRGFCLYPLKFCCRLIASGR